MDPGTSLAVVSLALQVTNGLFSYYELWTHADEDIIEVQRSLLSLANIFTQLDITLQKPDLQEHIVSLIRLTMKSCNRTIQSLQKRLEKLEQQGTPNKLRGKLKDLRRRASYIFSHKEIKEFKSSLDNLREDLGLAIEVLNLNTTATSLGELREIHDELMTLKAKIYETRRADKAIAQEKAIKASRASILAWLSPCNISNAHLSAYERREPNTGKWFLESSSFAKWRSSKCQFLWLVGNVGCGKTVLR
ncbi:hypothetical protein F4819DRAFT_64947 [Hypoxylon fuscum]|nr:hypothetical protein F4819DRAFT_64947 [Hypoxylon fuscum]